MAVSVVRAEPPCVGDYYGLFRCPVHFDAPATSLTFSAAVLELPLPARNRELARLNDQVLTALLAKLKQDDLISRVKVAIVERLPSGVPSAEDIAKDLYVTARTLQRRLADRATTYSEVLEIVRRELAEHYLFGTRHWLRLIGFGTATAAIVALVFREQEVVLHFMTAKGLGHQLLAAGLLVAFIPLYAAIYGTFSVCVAVAEVRVMPRPIRRLPETSIDMHQEGNEHAA